MNQGTLKFSSDGVESDTFFEDENLKQGPIWFAIALNNDTSVVLL